MTGPCVCAGALLPRTKTREGLRLNVAQLPMEHIQARRHDVLAEMARLQVHHEETHTQVHGTPASADSDRRRLTAARAAAAEARRRFRPKA